MIQLQLALLGPFQASWRGEPLSGFRSDKARALLAYLALAGEEPQPRAHLAALLWGEKGEAAARGSLRAALSNLRRILSPLKDEGRSPLKTTRHAVSWQPDERVWLDTAVLDTLLRQCRAHPHDYVAHCPACLPRLRQAVALYRGDFLVGLSLGGSPVFTEWQRIQQETWHQRVLSTLETLTGAYLQAGDWDAAVHYARRQLALVPWLEPAHRQLMRALAWRGEEAAALAQYHACRRILAEELEVEPEARTTALYQQIRDGRLPAAAPVSAPLRNNLPAAVTPFIGRKTEMDALCQQLSDPDYRLISLTGEGGVGKTRLALAAARQVLSHFPDGVWFIPLADTTAANNAEAALTTAITAVLGLAAAPPSASQLPAVLRQKQMLLILDNLEGLLAAASSAVIPFLLHLIRHAPGVSLLVTSRALLNVQAEWSLRLDGLPVPAAGETAIEEYASVRLFVERAGRISGGFRMTAQNRPHVADICRLSDGLPLAIELAAAWTSHYTCAEIARSMRQNLGFLASNLPDLPPRHRSIYAVMEHSWALLAPAEREAYRNLAVFQGSFTRAAAAEVTGTLPAMLVSLANKSLLRVESAGGQTRYGRHPLLSQFARQKLAESAQVESAAMAHARFYGRFLEAQEADLMGKSPLAALARVRPELDNIRQAWRWAAARGETAVINQMADALAQLFDLLGLYREMADLADAAGAGLADIDLSHRESTLAAGRVWGMAAAARFRLGQYQAAQSFSRRALRLLAGWQPHIAYAHALIYAGCAAFGLGELAETRRYWQAAAEAYATVGSLWGQTIACANLSELLLAQGEMEAAGRLCRQGYEMAKQLGNQELIGNSLGNLSLLAARDGRTAEAMRLAEKAVACHRQTGNPAHLANALASLAQAAVSREMLPTARDHLVESVSLLRQCGNHFYLINRLLELGAVEREMGHAAAAAEAVTEALQEAFVTGAKEMVLQAALALAILRQQQERPFAAARLAAFAAARAATDSPAQTEAQVVLTTVQAALSPAEWAAACRAGAAGDLPEMQRINDGWPLFSGDMAFAGLTAVAIKTP